MNKEHLKKVFDDYVASYDINEPKIKLKYEHTYQVADLSDKIAKSVELSQEDVDIAWTIGLLHDIGRFEQVVRYGTYRDAISVDHAQFGADLLFNDGLIEKFGIEDKDVLHLLEVAIRNHNVFKLPGDLNERELLFSKLIRDADKIDIMRANVEFPLEEICNVTTEELYSATVEQSTIDAFLRHETIVRGKNMGVADGIMNQIAFIFALEFPISLEIMVERGHVFQLMEFHSKNPDTEAKFELARKEVMKYISDNGLSR